MCLFDSDAYSASYVCMFGLCSCVCLIVILTVHRMFVCCGLCPCVCLIVMLTLHRMFVCLVCDHVFV